MNRRRNVENIDLHINAWRLAALEAQAAGQDELQRHAESRGNQLQFVKDRHGLALLK